MPCRSASAPEITDHTGDDFSARLLFTPCDVRAESPSPLFWSSLIASGVTRSVKRKSAKFFCQSKRYQPVQKIRPTFPRPAQPSAVRAHVVPRLIQVPAQPCCLNLQLPPQPACWPHGLPAAPDTAHSARAVLDCAAPPARARSCLGASSPPRPAPARRIALFRSWQPCRTAQQLQHGPGTHRNR